MGYPIENRSDNNEISKFLRKHQITPATYQIYEFYVRSFASEYDPASSFPDVNKEETDVFELSSYFRQFERDCGFPWGFHSLTLSSQPREINLQHLQEVICSLEESIPRDSRVKGFEGLYKKIQAASEDILFSAKRINHELATSKAWNKKIFLYLACSEVAAKVLLDIKDVDHFIEIKYLYYFPDQEILTKSEIASRVRTYLNQDLKDEFNAFLTRTHAEKNIEKYKNSRFRRSS
jgi:hypothetical protein